MPNRVWLTLCFEIGFGAGCPGQNEAITSSSPRRNFFIGLHTPFDLWQVNEAIAAAARLGRALDVDVEGLDGVRAVRIALCPDPVVAHVAGLIDGESFELKIARCAMKN